LSCFLFFFNALFGQNTLVLEYKKSSLDERFQNGLNLEVLKVRMLINDSIGHIHFFAKERDPIKKRKKTFGRKVIHQGVFLDFINSNYYDEVSLHDLSNYLIKRTSDKKQNWIIQTENKKIILGYNCTAALAVNEKNDSTLVYFTNDLKFKKGFLFYEGIDGVVLEAFDQRYGDGQHFEVIKIKESEINLVTPNCNNIMSSEEYFKELEKRNRK
jgi:GLPGLI family protein